MALDAWQVTALRDAYDAGKSIRDSASVAGVSKCTVTRWWRKWRFDDGGKEIRCVLDSRTKERFDDEARSRGLSTSALLHALVTEIVDDDLFNAVIDSLGESMVDDRRVMDMLSTGLTERCVAERLGLSIWQVKRSKRRARATSVETKAVSRTA